MKRLKMLLSITAFALAISAAFATKSSETLLIPGFIEVADPTPDCVQSIQCTNAGGPACLTINNEQVYEMDAGTSCNFPMTRNPE